MGSAPPLTIAISHQPSAIRDVPFFYSEFDAPDSQAISRGQLGLLDALVVDERAVGAFQVHHFQLFVASGDSAVQAGDERDIEDEIRARRAAHGLDSAGFQAEGRV